MSFFIGRGYRALFVFAALVLISAAAFAQTDVFDGAYPSLLSQIQCSGSQSNGVVFFADVNKDGTPDTMVVLTVVQGNGGLVAQSSTDYYYAFSNVDCSNNNTKPAQLSLRFVDSTVSGFVWNNPNTWTFKTVPSAQIDGNWDGGIFCPRPGTSNPYFKIQGYKDFNQIGEITATTTSLSGASMRYAFTDSAGVKELYVHSDFCENDLDHLVLSSSATPYISTQPQGLSLQVGMPVHLKVTASGTGTLQYQWYKNGAALKDGRFPIRTSPTGPFSPVDRLVRIVSGATTDTLAIYPSKTTDSGSYYVVVTNQAGSTTSDTVRVTIRPWTTPIHIPGELFQRKP